MAVQLPREIMNNLVDKGICVKTDLPTAEIKPIYGDGLTNAREGSSPNSTFEISFRGGDLRLFVKVNFSLYALPTFIGEFESLASINIAIPKLAPAPLTVSSLTSSTGAYLVTEYISMSPIKSPETHVTLALLLSGIHNYSSKNGKFGFPVQTMCRPPLTYIDVGEVWTDTWEEYFGNVMLKGLIEKLEMSAKKEDMASIEIARKVTELVVPKLLGDLKDIKPVLVNSDLWRGNWASDEKGKPVIFDPVCFYGHNELQLSIMHLMDSNTEQFWEIYHTHHPRREPYFNQRQRLYLFWLYFNHVYFFALEKHRIGVADLGKELLEWADNNTENEVSG